MSRTERVVLAASTIFLFVAPFAGSAGLRATCLIVAALGIAYAGLWRAAPPFPRALLAFLIAWFALALLSLAWTSNARLTLGELRAESTYGALAIAVFFILASEARRWRLWWLAIMLGTLLTLAARFVQVGLGVALWRHSPDGGVGAFSTHIVLIAPLVVALVCAAPWGFARGPAWIALAIATLLAAAWTTRDAWTTPNRIVWPALAVVFVVAAVAARRANGFRLSDGVMMRRVLAAGAIALAIAFTAAIAAKSERFYPKDSITASVERDLRPRLWAVAWDEIRKAPLLGRGLGREIDAEAFLPLTPRNVEHPPVMHAHNVFLNIALQLGLVGLALFGGVLVLLAREYVLFLGDAAVAPLGVIGLALLGGFITKNLTDDFFHRHNAHVFWALNGMLLGLASRRRSQPSAAGRP